MIVALPQGRADKYMLVRDVARHVRRIGADGLLHISEAWVAALEDLPPGRFADSAANRREALVLMGINSNGEQISITAEFERKPIKKHKVKRFHPTAIIENDTLMALAPVLEVWDKLDVLRIHEMDDAEIWARKHFAIGDGTPG